MLEKRKAILVGGSREQETANAARSGHNVMRSSSILCEDLWHPSPTHLRFLLQFTLNPPFTENGSDCWSVFVDLKLFQGMSR